MMRSCVALDERSKPEEALQVKRAAWHMPRMRALPAEQAEADHGELHFDSIGFS